MLIMLLSYKNQRCLELTYLCNNTTTLTTT